MRLPHIALKLPLQDVLVQWTFVVVHHPVIIPGAACCLSLLVSCDIFFRFVMCDRLCHKNYSVLLGGQVIFPLSFVASHLLPLPGSSVVDPRDYCTGTPGSNPTGGKRFFSERLDVSTPNSTKTKCDKRQDC